MAQAQDHAREQKPIIASFVKRQAVSVGEWGWPSNLFQSIFGTIQPLDKNTSILQGGYSTSMKDNEG